MRNSNELLLFSDVTQARPQSSCRAQNLINESGGMRVIFDGVRQYNAILGEIGRIKTPHLGVLDLTNSNHNYTLWSVL